MKREKAEDQAQPPPAGPPPAPPVRCHRCMRKKARALEGCWDDLKRWFCGIDCHWRHIKEDVGLTVDKVFR